MAQRKVGLKAAIADRLLARSMLVPETLDARQLDLLPLPPTEAIAAEPAPRSDAAKGGRPKGATNIATREIRDYILSRYRSPLVAMAECYSRPVDELARMLNCSKIKAYELQMAAQRDLAPYIHQKLTPLDALPAGSSFRLEVITGDGVVAAGDDAQPLGGVTVIENKENQ